MPNLIKNCPRCKKKYTEHCAISRRDNETPICPKCGEEEALFDFSLFEFKNKLIFNQGSIFPKQQKQIDIGTKLERDWLKG